MISSTTWHILLVDDDHEDQLLVREMLAESRQGEFQLDCVSSYNQALNAIQENQYAAVLVDYELGGESGIRLMRELHHAGYNGPILLLTGHGSYDVDMKAMEAGAADYLSKNSLSAALLERSIRFAIERNRLLEENHRQRDLLERIMEDSMMAVAVLQGPQHSYILANPAYNAIVRKGNLIGRTVAELWPEIADAIVPLLDHVYQTGEAFRAADRPFNVVRDRGLETVYYTFSYAPLHDRDGKVEGIVVTADDTTEQVIGRMTLLEWEGIFRSFFESETMLAGIIELSEDDVIYARVNKQMASYFNQTPEQMQGKTGREIGFDEQTRTLWYQRHQQVYESKIPSSFEYPLRIGGREGWFIATISPIETAASERPRFAFVAIDITDRKQWEELLAEALAATANERNRMESILQALPVGVCISDEEGGTTLANQEYRKVWGNLPETHSVQDYRAYKAWWVETGQLVEPHEWASAQVLKTKEPVLGQFLRIERFDGKLAYVVNSAAPIFDSQGQVVGSSVAILDVTRRVEAENALRENELMLKETAGRFQALAENISQLAWMTDETGWVFWYNQRWLDYTGTTLEEMQGWGWQKVQHPDHVEHVLAHYRSCIQSGEVWEDTFPLRGKDGQYRWFLSRAQPIRDEAGKITRWFGTNTDITELLGAEAALRESEARYKIMGEAMPYGVWLTSDSGAIEYASDSFLELLGMPLEELKVTNWWAERLDAEESQRLVAAWQYCLQTGMDWDEEFAVVDQRGVMRTIWSRGKPVRGEQGQILNWVGINMDVTARKRREQDAHFLASLGNQLVSPGEVDEVMRIVSERTAQHLNADLCYFGEEDWQTQQTIIRKGYLRGEAAFDRQYSLEQFPKGVLLALQAGQKVIVADTATDPLTHAHYQTLYEPSKVGAFVMLPRLVNEKWTGSFVIANRQLRSWMPDEIELLESVSNLAWLAIDQSRAQRQLRDAEERFRIALSPIPMFVFAMDRDLRYTWAYNSQLGIADGDLIGKRGDEIFLQDDPSRYMDILRSVIETGKGVQQEIKSNHKDSTMYFFLTAEPIFDTQKNVIGLTGASLNNTQQRRLEAEQVGIAAQMEVQRRLIQQREMERMDIARDLHDGVLQEMSALSFALAEAMTLDEKAARIERLKWVQENLLKQASEIRAFCNDLRPPALAPFGLEKAIRSHMQEFRHRNPEISVSLNLQSDRQTLPEEVRMALFRIYQELLNNINKHAKASQIWINWKLDDTEACLEIEDDGIGFEEPSDWVVQARTGHLGLLGIRERVLSVGGNIHFDTHPGKGTRVYVTVPRPPKPD